MVDWQSKSDKETWQALAAEDWQEKILDLDSTFGQRHRYGINTYGLGVYGIGIAQTEEIGTGPQWQHKTETPDMMSKTSTSWQEKL